jgi:hypothetical protein
MLDKQKNSEKMNKPLCNHFKIKLDRIPNHQTKRNDLLAEFINTNEF